MATATASAGTPLPRKLGIAPGARIRLVGAPPAVMERLVPWPPGARLLTRGDDLDIIVCFVTRRAQVLSRHAALSPAVTRAGSLWIAWPKRSSGVATDLSDQVVRELILPTGWVDVKVCAIDAVWSALRWVRRLELRS